jgi:hypothetical protein
MSGLSVVSSRLKQLSFLDPGQWLKDGQEIRAAVWQK